MPKEWTTTDMAQAWGVSISRAAALARLVPGARRENDRNRTWRVPAGSRKPSGDGREPQLSEDEQMELYRRFVSSETRKKLAEETGLAYSTLGKYFGRIKAKEER